MFRVRLFRESCVFHRGNYVKDLSRLGRELRRVIIVDNSPASYIFHPENAVSPVSPFVCPSNVFFYFHSLTLVHREYFLKKNDASDSLISLTWARINGRKWKLHLHWILELFEKCSVSAYIQHAILSRNLLGKSLANWALCFGNYLSPYCTKSN